MAQEGTCCGDGNVDCDAYLGVCICQNLSNCKLYIGILLYVYVNTFDFRDNELLFFFWLHCAACGISVPQPGMEPMPPAVEAWSQPLDRQQSPNTFDFKTLILGLPWWRSG